MRPVLMLLLLLCGTGAQAGPEPLPDLANGASRDIHQVLQGPDFNVKSTHTELRNKHAPAPAEGVGSATGGEDQGGESQDEPAGKAAPQEQGAGKGKPLPQLAEGAHKDIHEVLQGPAFNEKDSHTVMRSKHPDPPRKHVAPNGLSQFLGGLARVLLWGLLALVLVAALWNWRRWADLLVGLKPAPAPDAPAQIRRQPAVSERPLPDDIATAAEAAWARGDSRAALSMLYRGALAALHQRGHMPLPDSATEQENLRQVRASQPRETTEGFGVIMRAWLIEAYGGAHPADFAQVLAAYRRHFGGSRA